MANNNNIDVAVFQVPDGTITLPTWNYIMNQISDMMNTIITDGDSINEDLKTMDTKLASWAGSDPPTYGHNFDPSTATGTVFKKVSDMLDERQDIIASMKTNLDAITLEGGGVGETIEPGTQYIYDNTTYTAYTNAEIFNAYTEGSGRNGAAGSYSHAEGQYNNAYGSYSHAEGQSNITTESCAHAEGSYNKSTGYSSHTEGQNNQASGYAAHAEGGFTKALENYTHAEGQNTQVKSGAYNGHAEGYNTVVEKPCGHTEGRNTKVITNGECAHAEGDGTTASGNAAHSEGYMTTASGIYAHAEGAGCTASADQSHAEGSGTTASGAQSHSEGRNTTASGYQSHAEGDGTTAAATGSHAEGYGNEIKSGANYSHVEGGNNTVNSPAIYSHTEGRNHTVNALYGHAEGLSNTLGTAADCGHVEGSGNTVSAHYSHAEGRDNAASGICSHAEGNITKAIADYSHAEGNATKASGSISHAEGNGTEASGNGSHAEGYLTIASGTYAHAEGEFSKATAYYSHAEGSDTEASDAGAHAEGNTTKATKAQAHAEGWNTEASNYQAHAEGCDTKATGLQAHAEGYTTTAAGNFSHAEGRGTTASGIGSHCGGYYSTAQGSESFAHGDHAVAVSGSAVAFGDNVTASGSASFAFGDQTVSVGYNSFAGGYKSQSPGPKSFAHGDTCTSVGYRSIAMGYNTIAAQELSCAIGDNVTAVSKNQTVIGKFNAYDNNDKYSFIIGNGTDADNRSSALSVDWDGKIYVGDNNGVDVSGLYVTSNDDAKVLTATYQNGVGTYGWAPASGGECIIVTDTSTALPNKVVIENNHEYRYLNLANADSITISIENVDITKAFYSTVVLHNVTSTDILSNFVSVSQDSVLSNVIFLNEDFVDLRYSDTVEMLFFTNGMANSVMCIAYGYTSASPEPPAPIPDPDINEDKYNVYNLTTGETTIYDDQASAAAYLNANTDTNFDVYMGTNVATPATDPGYGDYGVYITTDWQNVSNLRKFTCNNKVTRVSEGAFRNSSLAEFIRGNGAGFQNSYYVYFKSGCFYGCTNMKSFDIYPPEGVTPPGACQFVTWDDEGIFEASGLETFTGGDFIDVLGVAATAWGKNMFKDCTSLTTVTLACGSPQADNELADGMFSGCTTLTTINVMDPELIYWTQDALAGCSDVTINRHDYVDTSRRTTWDEAGKPWGATSVTINTIYDLE